MANASEAQSESEVKTRQSTPITGKAPLRRPSKVSLSTLHRNPFPLKLDLSSASLRLDETALNMSSFGLGGLSTLGTMGGGLASPVTLAPKSARPMDPGEIPPEFLAALATATSNPSDQEVLMQNQDDQRIEIDLTLEDELQNAVNMSVLSAASGGSAEQPIDVDMDLDQVGLGVNELATDLFGDEPGGDKPTSTGDQDVDDLFGPMDGSGGSMQGPSEGLDMNILNALSNDHGQTDALFASLGGNQASTASTTNEPPPGFDVDSSATNSTFDFSQIGDMGDFLKNAPSDMSQFLGSISDSSGKVGGPSEAKSPDKPE